MALNISGQWTRLTQAVLDETTPEGQPLHFVYPGSRTALEGLLGTHGWENMVGCFVSSGQLDIPDLIIHRGDFPQQVGSNSIRATRLENYLDESADNKFKGPSGTAAFFVRHKILNHREDGQYVPPHDSPDPDYLVEVFSEDPGPKW
jgi:hypothetical protein